MKPDLVIVRLPYVPGPPPRTGVVVAQEGTLYRVRWDDDGTDEEVHLGDFERLLPAGSLEADALRKPDELREQLAGDPKTTFLRVLRESAEPMTVVKIKRVLTGLGCDAKRVEEAWTSVRPALIASAEVTVTGSKFSWSADAGPPKPAPEPEPVVVVEPVSAEKAPVAQPAPQIAELERQLAELRDQLAAEQERVREAEAHAEGLEQEIRAEHAAAVDLRAAQDRQLKIDVVRTLATVAAEVEELAAENTPAEILVERIRALASVQALEPIGSAGEKLPFDPALHAPIVGFPQVGAPVTVIRPGYRWRPAADEVLLDKAVVTVV